MKLRTHDFQRSVELANRQTGYERLWECPSDLRARDGVRAWAMIEVAWSPHLRTMVPTLKRIYTRTTGKVREVETLSVTAHGWSLPAGGPDDHQARARVFDLVQSQIPATLEDEQDTLLVAGVKKIFPAADIIDQEV